MAAPQPAHAFFDGLTRSFVRPEVSEVDAVVSLMDARSTLKEIEAIAATPADSAERFEARRLWPAFAKRLREVGPAAPVVVALVTKGDKEGTLSTLYGGTAGDQPGVADAVYQALGGVLTISGRTIRKEAQATPDAAKAARAAIEDFLAKVPRKVSDEAQAYRVKRAEAEA